MSYLSKVKNTPGGKVGSCFYEPATQALSAPRPYVKDSERHQIMQVMVDWNERAAMMTCGDLTVAQAEMAAWHDLRLDDVFYSYRRRH